MHSAAELQSIADALVAARSGGRETSFTAAPPTDTAAAYRIQDAVAQRHGGIDGWKVGARSPGAMPTCAPLLRGTVTALAAESATAVAVPGAVGVEVELAFRIARDFPPGCVVRDAEVVDAITGAHLTVELCASRLPAHARSDPLWLLADNQMNERLLVGPPLSAWGELDFATLPASLTVEGEMRVGTLGGHPSGDPIALLVWLVRHCAEQRGGVRSGAIVTTGSWTGMQTVAPPAEVTAALTGTALSFGLARR